MSVDVDVWRARFGAECVVPAAPGGFLPPAIPIIAPSTVEELHECVRFAAASRLRLLPAGATENLYRAPVREPIDVVLSVRRLTGILEYEPADFTLIVEAGATLHAIAAHLAPARQRLGPRPWPGVAATVGGACAANRNGIGRLGRGSWRDAVLGCRVVHVDGTSTKSGGRVVKNVSGYDLAKLYIGSCGTLVILTEINLRLFPLPETSAVVRAATAFSDAPALLLAAHRGALRPEALVVTQDEGGTTLWARFEGREAVVAAQAAACAALWKGDIHAGDDAAWQGLERFDVPEGDAIHLEAATLPVGIVDAVEVLRQFGVGAAHGLFGVGTVHFRLPAESSSRVPEFVALLAARGVVPRWSTHPIPIAAAAPALHTALQAAFDPERRLPTLAALAGEGA